MADFLFPGNVCYFPSFFRVSENMCACEVILMMYGRNIHILSVAD